MLSCALEGPSVSKECGIPPVSDKPRLSVLLHSLRDVEHIEYTASDRVLAVTDLLNVM